MDSSGQPPRNSRRHGQDHRLARPTQSICGWFHNHKSLLLVIPTASIVGEVTMVARRRLCTQSHSHMPTIIVSPVHTPAFTALVICLLSWYTVVVPMELLRLDDRPRRVPALTDVTDTTGGASGVSVAVRPSIMVRSPPR